VTSVGDATYIFGGQSYDVDLNFQNLNSISKFDEYRIWSQAGTLHEK